MFLDSLRTPDGKFPDKLEEDVLRPVLVARFRMARLYSKLICSLPSAQLENLNKALDSYMYEEPDVRCSICRLKHFCLFVKSADHYFVCWF